MTTQTPTRLHQLRVRNFRVLRDVELRLSPLSVFLGPNGSGKSTLLDVFALIQDAASSNLEDAWYRAGRMANLRSRQSSGPVEIDLTYSDEGTAGRPVRYHLAVDEVDGAPRVARELLQWFHDGTTPEHVLDFRDGKGIARDDETMLPRKEALSAGSLALSVFGQQDRYGSVQRTMHSLRDWHVSLFSAERARETATAGPQRRLASDGRNLSNVLQHLAERHPDDLREIVAALRRQVPRTAGTDTEVLPDDRLLLHLQDEPFDSPVLSRFVSEGTVKLLAYLILLHGNPPPGLLGIEEPDNQLHSRLIYGLAEEMRIAAGRSQLVVTTHSPYLVDALRPEELWTLYRADDGYARAVRAADVPRLMAQLRAGGSLGDLWMAGYFDVGDPLTRGGRPRGRVDGLRRLVGEESNA
ncbi:MAG TPA: AAA family ATPase [Mycobacteriales bacterium]|nr:AAA family ATPase [Mycobacteriales bacterium]